LAIAAGAVTHRNLLLEEPVKLPFLSVDLPLVGFFAIAPILFVIVHAYVLIHFVFLSDKIARFNEELSLRAVDDSARDKIRRQLPNHIFVQLLAGPREARQGAVGWLLRLSAMLTMVAAPIALLLLIQIQFLPYHLQWVTLLQRMALVLDSAVLLALWSTLPRAVSEIAWPKFRTAGAAMLICIPAVMFSLAVATYPGEWLHSVFPSARVIPIFSTEPKLHVARWTSLHNVLFNGRIDTVRRRRSSLWSNTLVLPEFDISEFTNSTKRESSNQTLQRPYSL
jgi:hypothetical protein